jgi:hypothetical protein
MTVINKPTSNNINEENVTSDELMIKKIITEEKDMGFRNKYKELDDVDSFCIGL